MLAILLVFCCSVALASYTMQFRTSVQLPANKNEVESYQYGGNYGKGSLSVVDGSAGNAKLILKNSVGGGWQTLTSIIVSPGHSDTTNVWGRQDSQYLFKIVVQSSPKVWSGNPGRIAYGTLYTGFEN